MDIGAKIKILEGKIEVCDDVISIAKNSIQGNRGFLAGQGEDVCEQFITIFEGKKQMYLNMIKLFKE